MILTAGSLSFRGCLYALIPFSSLLVDALVTPDRLCWPVRFNVRLLVLALNGTSIGSNFGGVLEATEVAVSTSNEFEDV